MKAKLNRWRLYNLATAYGQRPSDIAGLQTDLGRWFLDEACLVAGRQIQKIIDDGKDPFADLAPQPKKFRSARTRVRKKVKFRSDGTW